MCFYDQCTASFQTTRARQVHMSRVHGEVRFSKNRVHHISQIISDSSYVNGEQNVDNNINVNSSVSSSSVTSNDVDMNFDFGDVLPIIRQQKMSNDDWNLDLPVNNPHFFGNDLSPLQHYAICQDDLCKV